MLNPLKERRQFGIAAFKDKVYGFSRKGDFIEINNADGSGSSLSNNADGSPIELRLTVELRRISICLLIFATVGHHFH